MKTHFLDKLLKLSLCYGRLTPRSFVSDSVLWSVFPSRFLYPPPPRPEYKTTHPYNAIVFLTKQLVINVPARNGVLFSVSRTVANCETWWFLLGRLANTQCNKVPFSVTTQGSRHILLCHPFQLNFRLNHYANLT